MEPSAGLHITESDDELLAKLPARRNPAGATAALLFGVPWLLLVVGASVFAVVAAPPGQLTRVLLALFVGFVLTILITALALLAVWYAAYTLWGFELLRIDLARLSVTRGVAGIRIPFRARRGLADRVVPVEPTRRGGATTRYRLEAHAGRSKLRFGAGLRAREAEELLERAEGFIARTREAALRAREATRSSGGRG